MCFFSQILKQIHPNQFSEFLISQKQAVRDCAAARESIEHLKGVSTHATKQKNALTNCDTAPKSGYSCSKFIHIRKGTLLFVKFMQQNVTLLPFIL